MHTAHSLLALLACLAISSFSFAQTTDHAKIEGLIKKLGSESYAQRESARKELEGLGTASLDTLRRAAMNADLETKRRLTGVIAILEERRVREWTAAPKMVRLKLDGVSVKQSIEELARVSGYPLELIGHAAKLADKRITLDTGTVPYWQALDQLCEQAGLVERIDLETNVGLSTFLHGRSRVYVPPAKAAAVGPLLLTPGVRPKSRVHIAGSLKTEVRIVRDADAKELVLTFIVSAEPRLQNAGVVGMAMLDTIVDQDSRKLAIVPERAKTVEQAMAQMLDSTPYPPLHPGRSAQIRVKEGDAKRLRELAGKLTLVVEMPDQELARVPNILAAAGKSVKAIDDTGRGKLTVNNARKLPNSETVEVSLSMENLAPDPYRNSVVIKDSKVIIRSRYDAAGIVLGPNGITIHGNGAGASKNLPDLIDANGKKFKLAATRSDTTNHVQGERRNAQVLYTPEPGQSEPRDLVLYGIRTYALTMPFRFDDLPLP